MTLTDLTRILPNARQVEFEGCIVIIDRNGKEIGYWDEGFYLNEGYEHGQAVYERFLGEGLGFDGFYKNNDYGNS